MYVERRRRSVEEPGEQARMRGVRSGRGRRIERLVGVWRKTTVSHEDIEEGRRLGKSRINNK
jgi:hypothetical protein